MLSFQLLELLGYALLILLVTILLIHHLPLLIGAIIVIGVALYCHRSLRGRPPF